MQKVLVLMSTYNGEKYIQQQIDSLLAQRNVDISIMIRDDGSNDNTINIVQGYILHGHKISLIKGENIGPAKSFLELLSLAPDSEYYAFCDQDDFWMKDKVDRAIHKIRESGKSNIPLLYFSNLTIVDEKLNPIPNTDINKFNERKPNKYISLVDNIGTGCTMVMNRTLKELIVANPPSDITMHDAWCNIVCSMFGEIIIDNNSYIFYRQHSNNTIGMDTSKNVMKNTRIHFERLRRRNLQPRLMNAKSLLECFGDQLSEKDHKKVMKIVLYKKSIIHRLSLLFDFSIRSYSLINDLRYRILIITGEI